MIKEQTAYSWHPIALEKSEQNYFKVESSDMNDFTNLYVGENSLFRMIIY